MKLRWNKEYTKVWRNFTHSDGSQDGGYAFEETGEKTLQFLNDEGEWEDVPEFGKYD